MYDYDNDDAEGRRFSPRSDAWQVAVADLKEMYARTRTKHLAAQQDDSVEPEAER
ncbi:hypothetical protein [Kitasatospora sp. NPDC001132]